MDFSSSYQRQGNHSDFFIFREVCVTIMANLSRKGNIVFRHVIGSGRDVANRSAVKIYGIILIAAIFLSLIISYRRALYVLQQTLFSLSQTTNFKLFQNKRACRRRVTLIQLSLSQNKPWFLRVCSISLLKD